MLRIPKTSKYFKYSKDSDSLTHECHPKTHPGWNTVGAGMSFRTLENNDSGDTVSWVTCTRCGRAMAVPHVPLYRTIHRYVK